MLYRQFILLLLLFPALPAVSQTDSLAVVNARWDSKKIDRRVKLKVCDLKIFNSNQHISFLQVKPSRRVKLDLGYEEKLLTRTSEHGIQAGAAAALNGTFFDVKNGGSVNYIRSDGRIINQNRPGINGSRKITQKAAVVFNRGKIRILQWDGSDKWEDKLDGEDVMVTGPALIANNKRVNLDSSSFVTTRHPRSVVATKGKKVYLLTVDGRNKNAAGMSLFELANFLKWLKADYAVNLDGGGSTCLWVNNFSDTGVVNYPSDNKKWDHVGERKVANVILVNSKRHR